MLNKLWEISGIEEVPLLEQKQKKGHIQTRSDTYMESSSFAAGYVSLKGAVIVELDGVVVIMFFLHKWAGGARGFDSETVQSIFLSIIPHTWARALTHLKYRRKLKNLVWQTRALNLKTQEKGNDEISVILLKKRMSEFIMASAFIWK